MTLAIDKNCSFLLINIDDRLNTINYIHVVYRVSVFFGSLYVIVMPGNNQRILTDSRSLIGVFLSYVDVLVSLTCTAIATLNKYMKFVPTYYVLVSLMKPKVHAYFCYQT